LIIAALDHPSNCASSCTTNADVKKTYSGRGVATIALGWNGENYDAINASAHALIDAVSRNPVALSGLYRSLA
jgi:hypothetical protein